MFKKNVETEKCFNKKKTVKKKIAEKNVQKKTKIIVQKKV